VVIEDLVMPFEPTVIPNMETIDIKEEPLEQSIDSVSIQMVHQRMKSSSFATISDKNEVFQQEIVLRHSQQSELCSKPTDILSTKNEVFQSKMENEILKLFEEFDMMTLHNYYQTRVIKVRQLVEKYQTITQKGICKLHDETLEVKTNELNKIKVELQITKTTNLTLSKRIQELEMASNQVFNLKQNFESFDNEEVLEESELLEPLKCSKTGVNQPDKLNSEAFGEVKLILEESKEIVVEPLDTIPEQGPENEGFKMPKPLTQWNSKRKSLQCPLCPKKFYQRGHLSTHISAVHEDKKPFECERCAKCFKEKSKLNRHIAGVHEPRKDKDNLKCHICSKIFTQSSHVLTHISAVHKNRREFECPVCQMTFKENGKLTRHTNVVHENKKPFKCTSCLRAFARKSNLKTHEKICKNSESSHRFLKG
jgi:uncharacterized C2H2 Zn-finger protein